MPIEGPDRFGKQIGGVAAVKPREDDLDSFSDEGEVSSYVRQRVNDLSAGRSDDILIDDVAGPVTLRSHTIIAEGFPLLRFISDLREVGDRDIEAEIRELADIYDAIYSASNENEGMKTAHKLFMESLYPSDNLPLLEAVSTYLDEDGSAKNLQLTLAVDCFADAMRTVKRIAEEESISYYDAFLDAYGDSLSARNYLVGQMVRAKKEAYECIKQNRRLIKDINLAQRADDLIVKYEELENGLEFNRDFIAKLEDPATKAVVISLDFNSTFNSKESYPAMELVARVQRELAAFTRAFRRKYPDKKLSLVVNTGRPGLYAWGVVESAFAPVAEIREVAVGETGGVILEEGLNTGKMKVAVDNPEAWKSELDSLKSFLLEMIDDPGKVVIEPKMSMLSIRLAEKDKYLLKAKDGKVVNERWVGEQIQRHFELTDNHLDGKLGDLMEEINSGLPQLADYTVKAVNACRNDGEGRGLNGRKKKVLEGLKEVMALIEESHQKRIAEIESRTLVVDRMYKKGELVARYNPTAGYVDIGHRDVNKFSTLMKYVTGTQNISPDDVLFVQIGDSTTDILPTENIGEGEPNEGADEAFLIAVNNCNEKMQNAVEDRDQYGLFTRNQAVLGVEAMFKGLRALVSRSGGVEVSGFMPQRR